MSIKISGLDKLEKNFDRIIKNVKSLSGTYSFDELFPPAFMRKYTEFPNIHAFLEACGFPAATKEEFEAIPDASFDEYVKSKTQFKDWANMQDVAANELIAAKLNL